MHEAPPEVYILARPELDYMEIVRYLTTIKGEAWIERVMHDLKIADGNRVDADILIEFMGRVCYRSFVPGINPNVTKVREDPAAYFANLLASGHGSVLEHATFSFLFANVSRVVTHELVRHRAGVAISQESLRFVRLTDLPFNVPDCIETPPELREEAHELLARMEAFQAKVADCYDLDNPAVPFAAKKAATSAMRRYAPMGVATSIGWSANVRALRHVITERTAPGAEIEIRALFDVVAQRMTKECPLLFADFTRTDGPDGIGVWTPGNRKV